MTVATTEAGLLRAICEDPAADDLRLIYADWLEENGQPERSEFIRVQVELASNRFDARHCYGGRRGIRARNEYRSNLRRREQELLDLYWNEKKGFYTGYEGFLWIGARNWPRQDLSFRRGFIARAQCKIKDWEEYGPTLVQAAPIEKVVLTDRRPWDSLRATTRVVIRGEGEIPLEPSLSWWWFDPDVPTSDDHGEAAQLPACIMAHLPPSGFLGRGHRAWSCYNHDEANAAASLACANWARSAQGLPLLP